MNIYLLVITHLIAATLGAALSYFVVSTGGGNPPHLHHPRRSKMNTSKRPTRTGLILLLAAAIVLVLGVQGVLFQKQNHEADKDRAASVQTQLVRTNCLNKFANDLVDTLQTRADTLERVAVAQRRHDNAIDKVILAVAGNKDIPPTKNDADFVKSLNEFRAASDNLKKVKTIVSGSKFENKYKTPQAKCG